MQALPPSSGPIGPSYQALPPPAATHPVTSGSAFDPWAGYATAYDWILLPDNLIYQSYLAGPHEPRIGSQLIWSDYQDEFVWDVALGGRAGLLRHGTDSGPLPEGWQIDIEGAAFPRLLFEDESDLASVDFRFGIPWTMRRGVWEAKFGYYHISSHLGDEFILDHPGFERLNYSRDSLVLGVGIRPRPDLRLYAETAWAFHTGEFTEPWEFQFGGEYAPVAPTGFRGSPFLALNAHLHEELDFGGSFTAQGGWMWRGQSGQLFRAGLHVLAGRSNQYQFHRFHENQVGFGLWYDF
jgi:hypothetical protein